MKIVDVTQRSSEWLRWRARGVTASEAAIVLGRSPYKTPWRLWAERTGLAREADLSSNPHVQRGVAREDWARKAFEERHGTMLLPLCGESEEHPVLRASFDGIADDGSPVELKVPAERTFAEVAAKKTEAPAFRLYWPQVQHQLFVADAERGWLMFSNSRWTPNSMGAKFGWIYEIADFCGGISSNSFGRWGILNTSAIRFGYFCVTFCASAKALRT